MDDELYTVKDVAVMLNSSEFQIRVYINRNDIKAHKAGDGENVPWKIWKKDLMDFLNRNAINKDKDITNDELYTVEDCATILRTSTVTVRGNIRRRELAAFKIGTGKFARWRVWKSDLLEFINKRSNMDEPEKK